MATQRKGNKDDKKDDKKNDKKTSTTRVQGEGDYEAARRYDKAQHEFVESGQVEPAARDAEPRTPQEAQELEQAEQAGRARAKEEDPAVRQGSGGSGSGRRKR